MIEGILSNIRRTRCHGRIGQVWAGLNYRAGQDQPRPASQSKAKARRVLRVGEMEGVPYLGRRVWLRIADCELRQP